MDNKIPEYKVGSDGVSRPVSEINPDDIKAVENVGVDVRKYDKKETKIEKVSILQVNSSFSETGKQWVLKVEGNAVESIKKPEGDGTIDFRPSELFNLVQNDKGELIGFPTGEGSNLMKFLKDLGVQNAQKFQTLNEVIKSMVGKTALIKTYDKKSAEGQVKTFMKFRY